jgi:hypothetical protein
LIFIYCFFVFSRRDFVTGELNGADDNFEALWYNDSSAGLLFSTRPSTISTESPLIRILKRVCISKQCEQKTEATADEIPNTNLNPIKIEPVFNFFPSPLHPILSQTSSVNSSLSSVSSNSTSVSESMISSPSLNSFPSNECSFDLNPSYSLPTSSRLFRRICSPSYVEPYRQSNSLCTSPSTSDTDDSHECDFEVERLKIENICEQPITGAFQHLLQSTRIHETNTPTATFTFDSSALPDLYPARPLQVSTEDGCLPQAPSICERNFDQLSNRSISSSSFISPSASCSSVSSSRSRSFVRRLNGTTNRQTSD